MQKASKFLVYHETSYPTELKVRMRLHTLQVLLQVIALSKIEGEHVSGKHTSSPTHDFFGVSWQSHGSSLKELYPVKVQFLWLLDLHLTLVSIAI